MCLPTSLAFLSTLESRGLCVGDEDNKTEGSILKNEGDYPLRVWCHQRPSTVAPYPLWWGVDQGAVEAGGLGI